MAPIAPAHLVGRRVEHEIGEGQPVVRAAAGSPAQQRPYPGQQLLVRERLDQIVVGAGVEPAHPVGGRVARGEHEHQRVGASARRRSQTARPSRPGQHQVEHDEVGRRARRASSSAA